MKYFFLTDGWVVGRVWEFGGLWNEAAWRRKPDLQRMNLCIQTKGEQMWLYRAEEAVLMVEVRQTEAAPTPRAPQAIGQVVLKQLMSADQAIAFLCSPEVTVESGDRSNPLA